MGGPPKPPNLTKFGVTKMGIPLKPGYQNFEPFNLLEADVPNFRNE